MLTKPVIPKVTVKGCRRVNGVIDVREYKKQGDLFYGKGPPCFFIKDGMRYV
jgi:hypothetical protein